MADFRRQIVGNGIDIAIRIGREWLDNGGLRKKPVSVPSITVQESSGCITCSIYQEVALARAYVIDLQGKLLPDGSIPAGLGGTMHQAQTHVDVAMMQIPKVMGVHPTIDRACGQLSECLPDIYTRLEYVRGRDDLSTLALKLEHAGKVAYSIPEAMYRREEIAAPAQSAIYAEVLTPEDREVLDFIRDLRKEGATEEEARMRFAHLVFSRSPEDGSTSPNTSTSDREPEAGRHSQETH